MIYTSCSIKEVLGRIVRNTRIQDASYMRDAEEWIPEAMGYMRTRMSLQFRRAHVVIEFYKGKLPCNLRTLLAVEYQGQRLPYFNGIRNRNSKTNALSAQQISAFTTSFVSRDTPDGEGQITETELTAVQNLPLNPIDGYFTELDWINTTFSDGIVKLYFKSIPVDEEGFPLIPDNENYKEALYWYCRGKMIGSGFKDPAYSFQYCDQKFELHAVRAMNQIRYPSVDQMEARLESQSRLVLPSGWYNSFFSPLGSEEIYR